ncbi:hypothetical protein C8K18_10536 [Paraburkholderia sp. GV068]|jgi:hypothetical protein|nr:hypothetical protein C8K19_10536 [Paraburkholderia sp. GV072]PUB05121.1 hypothetical protein C8K18_10536 [Paraburkholderia sp. GV068]
MPERRARRGRPVDPLARLFYDVTGEKPDDAILLRMRRVSTALNLRDNDALWSVLAVLEYYARLYEVSFPRFFAFQRPGVMRPYPLSAEPQASLA